MTIGTLKLATFPREYWAARIKHNANLMRSNNERFDGKGSCKCGSRRPRLLTPLKTRRGAFDCIQFLESLQGIAVDPRADVGNHCPACIAKTFSGYYPCQNTAARRPAIISSPKVPPSLSKKVKERHVTFHQNVEPGYKLVCTQYPHYASRPRGLQRFCGTVTRQSTNLRETTMMLTIPIYGFVIISPTLAVPFRIAKSDLSKLALSLDFPV